MKHLFLIGIAIIIVVGLFGYSEFTGFTNIITGSGIEPQDYSSVNFFSQGLPTYSISKSLFLDCNYVNEMYVKYVGESTFNNVAFDSSGNFNPVISFDVTSRTDGRVIDQLRIDLNHKCDIDPAFKNNLSALKVSGSFLMFLGTGALGDDIGNEITGFETVSVNSNVPLDGSWKVIASKTYTNIQSLEPKLILHNNINAWIKAFATPSIDYDFFYADSRNNFNGGDTNPLSLLTQSAWLVRADANVISPPEQNANTANEPIFLDDIRTTLTKSQGGQDGTISDTNPLDTNKQSGRQLLIEGTVRKWLNTEGLPAIKINGASGVSLVSGTMIFDKKIGDDGHFVFYYTMAKNTPNGKYTVIMEHPNRFQGDFKTLQQSTKTFIVENEATIITTTSNGEICNSSGCCIDTDGDGNCINEGFIKQTSTGGQKSFFGEIVLVWTALYENGKTQTGIIGSDGGFDVELANALSLANSVDNVNSILKSIQVTPVLHLKDASVTSQFTIESSDVTFATLIVIGKDSIALDTRNTILFSPTKALCISQVDGTLGNTSVTCANEGFSLGSVILGTDAITNKVETLQSVQNLPNGGTAKMSIVVDIAGTFDARNDIDGKKYSGKTDGSQFTWDTTYIKGQLGQTVVIVTDDETGETKATTTTDKESSGSENPEKDVIETNPNTPTVKNQCKFADDSYVFINSICDAILVFQKQITDLNDGTCHSKDFVDSNGISREVVFCASLDQTIGTGGASGSAGGGLGNNDGSGSGDGDNGKGSGGLGGFCEGTIVQCASAFTENIDKKLQETIGLDSVELGLVLGGIILVIFIIAGLSMIAKRRNDSFNPMNFR